MPHRGGRNAAQDDRPRPVDHVLQRLRSPRKQRDRFGRPERRHHRPHDRSARGPNLDANPIARHNEIASLAALSDQLYKDWKNGDQEVKRLRALADKTTDPAEKQDLKAFADWLGGALWRQRKIGRDLDGFVAYLNTRDMMHIDESTAQANLGVYGMADPSTAHGIPGEFAQPTGPETYPSPLSINYDASDTSQAEAAAKDFSQRVRSSSATRPRRRARGHGGLALLGAGRRERPSRCLRPLPRYAENLVSNLRRLALAAVAVAFGAVTLGSWTRINGQGMSCPAGPPARSAEARSGSGRTGCSRWRSRPWCSP